MRERLLAVHHTGASGVAELLHELCVNLDSRRFLLLLLFLRFLLLRFRFRGLHLRLGGDLGGEVFVALFDSFAEVVSGEATDGDLLTNLGGRLLHELLNGLARVLDVVLRDERLLVHHLVDATGDNLLANVLRLGQQVFLLHFDGALTLHHLLVGIGRVDVLNLRARGDLHGEVLREFLEPVTAGDEVGLAVEFEQDADAAAGVDVRHDATFGGDAARLLVRGGHALLAQPRGGFFDATFALLKRLLAVHHTGAGGVAELLDRGGGNAASGCGRSRCSLLFFSRSSGGGWSRGSGSGGSRGSLWKRNVS